MGTFLRQTFLLLFVTYLRAVHSIDFGLKWVRVRVPQFRMLGESATLDCDYDIGNDTLYAVKWYKDHEEFYRYVPKSRPQTNWYKLEGIDVDVSMSDNRRVVLHPVSWKTSGLFRCEVSAEAPTFASAQSDARMEVLSLPLEDPTIDGVAAQYRIGDEINLNCTSGKSHPESILHWYINEQQIPSHEALTTYPPEQHSNGLVSTKLGLRFILSNHHFLRGSLKIKCVASIAPVIFKGDKETIVQSSEIMKDLREALLLVRSSCGKISQRGFMALLIFLFLSTYKIFWKHVFLTN